ncbi:LuxR family transcriptional regulator [Nocardioides euryhalodurans]|uniref:Response regulator transcription factor n=1 Tax=Nocardioides euryhalodurans TaxID=2518370 RepID=A0A4P7GH46_9ACTN|nr:response regulator transcription factor [Nocardioides euryhalodurans]QBR91198.1 response regulator transcription factor [Nocardioides euryhalodurans]
MTTMAKVLVAPGDTLEADCTVLALDHAGLSATETPARDVDVVVLFSGPDTESARMRELCDGRPMLLVSPEVDAAAVRLAERVGAAGLLAWGASTADMVAAIDRLNRGERGLPSAAAAAEDPLSSLTDRELEIVRLLGAGATNEAIARALGISYHTVRTHVGHVLAKLGVSHRYAVVALAHRSDRLARAGDPAGSPP